MRSWCNCSTTSALLVASTVCFLPQSAHAQDDGPVGYSWVGAAAEGGGQLSGPHTGSGSTSTPGHLNGRKEFEVIDTEQGAFNVTYFPIRAGDSVSFTHPDEFFLPRNSERTVDLGGFPDLERASFSMKWATFNGGQINANMINIANQSPTPSLRGEPSHMEFNGTQLSAEDVTIFPGEPADMVDPDVDITFKGGKLEGKNTLAITSGSNSHFNPQSLPSGELVFDGTEVNAGTTTLDSIVTAKNAAKLNSGNTTIALTDNPDEQRIVKLEGDSTWAVTGFLEVARDSQARLDIDSGSSIAIEGQFVGATNEGSFAEINVDSEKGLSTTTTFEIGRSGSSLLDIARGGKVIAEGDAFLGTFETGRGTILISGSDSILEAKGNLNVGNGRSGSQGVNGFGRINVFADGQLIVAEDKELRIGRREGSAGEVKVGSGATAEVGNMIVGQQGTGKLEVGESGTFKVTGRSIVLGENATANGEILINSSSATFDSRSAMMTIGKEGTGKLQISEGARYNTAGSDILADAEDSHGSVMVEGEGSSWKVNGSPQIGKAGMGTISIAEGAEATAVTAFLGVEPSGEGTATVSGSSSRWAQSDGLIVGHEGTGTLMIKEGARVQTDQEGVIAALEDSKGEVEITGANSKWTIGDDLIVGQRGEGKLTLKEGATVEVEGRMAIGLHERSKGTLVLDGDDVDITTSDNLVLSGKGEGKIELKNGATLGLREVTIGESEATDGTGELLVDGVGSSVETNGSFGLGSSSKGLLRILNGASVTTNGDVSLSTNEGAEADATVCSETDPSHWNINGNVSTGAKGITRVTVKKNAKMNVTGNFEFGGSTDDEISSLAFDGSLASLTLTGELNVGGVGAGKVSVKQGASVTVGDLVLSSTPVTIHVPVEGGVIVQPTERHAELEVIGTGSKLTVTDTIRMGTFSGRKGEFRVGNDASVSSDKAVLAEAAGSFAEVHIADAARWTIDDTLTLGQGGRGDLDVTGASMVSASSVVLGKQAGSQGVLRLREVATFNHNGPITVGDLGNGNLQVFGGATMNSMGAADVRGFESLVLVRSGGKWNVGESLAVWSDASMQIDNGGQVSVDGRVGTINGGRINIFANGQLEGDALFVDGRVTIGDAGSLVMRHNITLTPAGQLVVGPGTGNIGAGQNQQTGTLRVGPGGSLHGSGNVLGSVVVDGGTIAPGESPGTLTIDGDLVLGSGSLALEIAGDSGGEFDQLVVTGSTNLGGELKLDLIDGFIPAVGQSFEFLNLQDVAGEFAAIDLFPGLEVDSGELLANGSLSVTAVPEFWPGDANGDDEVSFADFLIVASNFESDGNFQQGDFNLDDRVNFADFLILANNFGTQVRRGSIANPVPEPGGVLMLAVALLSVGLFPCCHQRMRIPSSHCYVS